MLCSCDNCKDSDTLFNQLSQLGKNLRYDEQLNEFINLFSTLGNMERLIIINVLKEKDRCVCELEAILDKSQPSISHHLRELEKLNLIRGLKKGKFTYYSLNKKKLNSNLVNILNSLRV
ncbi:MAG: ArsR family transcriptional regulator [Promethearchaeota archaeon]|nr:MAG: ArsR family transcriptional regulator [Candidatus Lokiarchaeota archaeon]